eukprot:1785761-Rhodomonas_salina.1
MGPVAGMCQMRALESPLPEASSDFIGFLQRRRRGKVKRIMVVREERKEERKEDEQRRSEEEDEEGRREGSERERVTAQRWECGR